MSFHSKVITIFYYSFSELAKVAESRAHFENMSQSMDDALVKNAGMSRSKPIEATDERNKLTAVS